MFALTKELRRWLLTVPEGDRPWYSIILWWELRRIPYNLLLFVVGVSSFVLMLVTIDFESLPEKDIGDPFPAVVLFAIGANLAYTLGWLAELVSRRLWKEESRTLGPKFLTLGIIFSVSLCVFPALGFLIVWVISLLSSP